MKSDKDIMEVGFLAGLISMIGLLFLGFLFVTNIPLILSAIY